MKRVQFFREPNNQILAVFIDDKEEGYAGIRSNPETLMVCYSHVGQHSTTTRDYLDEKCKWATRLEFEPLLEELEGIYSDQELKPILPTKKAYKELLRVDPYTSVGFGRRITTWVCFWDWDDGVYGVRSAGWKFGCYATGVQKKLLVDQFYDYLFVNGIRPDYSKLKVAETDEQRFKTPISLNW